MTLCAFLLLIACGEKDQSGRMCAETCDRLYGESDDECGIAREARTTEELIDYCTGQCTTALTVDEGATYDVINSRGAAEEFQLRTSADAEAWAECIEDTPCSDLDKGFCPPVW